MFRQWFGRGGHVSDCSTLHTSSVKPHITLDCLNLNETGEIDDVPEEALLEALGFRPGKKVCLRCRTRFGGPVIAEVEGRHTALGRELARKIRLRQRGCSCSEHE